MPGACSIGLRSLNSRDLKWVLLLCSVSLGGSSFLDFFFFSLSDLSNVLRRPPWIRIPIQRAPIILLNIMRNFVIRLVCMRGKEQPFWQSRQPFGLHGIFWNIGGGQSQQICSMRQWELGKNYQIRTKYVFFRAWCPSTRELGCQGNMLFFFTCFHRCAIFLNGNLEKKKKNFFFLNNG